MTGLDSGGYYPHQRFVATAARINPSTPMILCHATGTGKTISMVSIIEKLGESPYRGFIFVTRKQVTTDVKSSLKRYIEFSVGELQTMEEFRKKLVTLLHAGDIGNIKSAYGNRIILIDEIHTVTEGGSDYYDSLLALRNIIGNTSLFVFATATPIINEVGGIVRLARLVNDGEACNQSNCIEQIRRHANVFYKPSEAACIIVDEATGPIPIEYLGLKFTRAVMSPEQAEFYRNVDDDAVYTNRFRAAISMGPFSTIEEMQQRSAIITTMAGDIISYVRNELPGVIYIYADRNVTDGIAYISQALELIGFVPFGYDAPGRPKYAKLRGDTPVSESAAITECMNSKENWDGGLLKVVIFSYCFATGTTFKNPLCIMEIRPHWNPAAREQTSGRVARIGSFDAILEKYRENPSAPWVQTMLHDGKVIVRRHRYMIAFGNETTFETDKHLPNFNVYARAIQLDVQKEMEMQPYLRELRMLSLDRIVFADRYRPICPELYPDDPKIPQNQVYDQLSDSIFVFAAKCREMGLTNNPIHWLDRKPDDPKAPPKEYPVYKKITAENFLRSVVFSNFNNPCAFTTAFEESIRRLHESGATIADSLRMLDPGIKRQIWKYQHFFHILENGVLCHNLRCMGVETTSYNAMVKSAWRVPRYFLNGQWEDANDKDLEVILASVKASEKRDIFFSDLEPRLIYRYDGAFVIVKRKERPQGQSGETDNRTKNRGAVVQNIDTARNDLIRSLKESLTEEENAHIAKFPTANAVEAYHMCGRFFSMIEEDEMPPDFLS